jgi:ribosomal protein S18 acetylase RimI-like enzyme
MTERADAGPIRTLTELDIGSVVRIDEKLSGRYRPAAWEQRVGYYLRRDPEASRVAELDGRVVGFMLGEVRGGEFGQEEPTGWIEFFGVDPDHRGRGLGRQLMQALLAHFRARGVRVVRTLADRNDAEITGFLRAAGFGPSVLEALEQRLD